MSSVADASRMVGCPYDSSHKVRYDRIQYHLMKCRKNHPNADYVICPFNASHHIPRSGEISHLTNCPDRWVIDHQPILVPSYHDCKINSRGSVSTASLPFQEDPDFPESFNKNPKPCHQESGLGRAKSANLRPRPPRNPGKLSDKAIECRRTDPSLSHLSLSSSLSSQYDLEDVCPIVASRDELPSQSNAPQVDEPHSLLNKTASLRNNSNSSSKYIVKPDLSHQSDHEGSCADVVTVAICNELPGHTKALQVEVPCSLLSKIASLRSNSDFTQCTSTATKSLDFAHQADHEESYADVAVPGEFHGQAHSRQAGLPCSLINKISSLHNNSYSKEIKIHEFSTEKDLCSSGRSLSGLGAAVGIEQVSESNIVSFIRKNNESVKENQDSTPSFCRQHNGVSLSNSSAKSHCEKIGLTSQHVSETKLQNNESSLNSQKRDSASFEAVQVSRRSPGDASRAVPGLGRAELIRRFKKL